MRTLQLIAVALDVRIGQIVRAAKARVSQGPSYQRPGRTLNPLFSLPLQFPQNWYGQPPLKPSKTLENPHNRVMKKAHAYLRVSGKGQVEGDGFTR